MRGTRLRHSSGRSRAECPAAWRRKLRSAAPLALAALALVAPAAVAQAAFAAVAQAAFAAVAQDPCPDPGAPLQLILQRESTGFTPERFAGRIEEPEIVVEPGVFDVYVAVVSQLPPSSPGVYGWNIFADVTGGLELLSADVAGTVAARTTDDPPGLVAAGFGGARVFDRVPYGRFALGSVVFAFDNSIAIDPVGTATAFRMRIAGENGSTGTIRLLAKLEDAADGSGAGDGGGASLLPCCSEAGVGGEILPFGCRQQVSVRVVDSSRGCATPPDDASGPIAVSWERRYDFFPATSGATAVAAASDGGAVLTGWHSAESAWVLKADAAGEIAWVTLLSRLESLDLFAVAVAPDGGFVLAGEATYITRSLYLVKLRGDGSIEWERLFEPPLYSQSGSAIVAAGDGGYAIGADGDGRFQVLRVTASGEIVFERELGAGTCTGIAEEPRTGALVVTGERDATAVVIKTGANGEPMWERAIAPPAPYAAARLRDVTIAADGEIFAVGSVRTPVNPYVVDSAAILFASFAPDGTRREERILASNGWAREAHAIHPAADGGFLVLALSQLIGLPRFHLLKLDTDRSLLWQSELGERRLMLSAADLAVTSEGAVLAAGTSSLVGCRPWLARVEPLETLQRPSDMNQDGQLDLSDGVCLLGFLFGTGGGRFRMPCGDGTSRNPANISLMDGNLDGRIDISDAIGIFAHLFLGHRPPALGRDCVPIMGCPGVCAS